jgi:hypothetical protein
MGNNESCGPQSGQANKDVNKQNQQNQQNPTERPDKDRMNQDTSRNK